MRAPITLEQAWSVIAETYWPEGSKPAQPDCRTCAYMYYDEYDLEGCIQKCTNGDKYIAVAKVVLWRTES